MWIIGWANCDTIPGDNYCHNLVGVSFSAMLEKISDMKIMYIIWLPFFALLTSCVVGIVLAYEPLKGIANPNSHAYESVDDIAIAHAVFSIVKITGLVLVAVFDLSADGVAHLVCASLAFISAIINTWLLFTRRALIVYYHHPDEKMVDLKDALKNEPYYNKAKIFLFFNFICVLFGLAMLISFAVTSIGLLEFFLTLYVVLDVLWIIMDVGTNPHFISQTYNSFIRFQGALRLPTSYLP